MREILYRGKNELDEKEWLYGNLEDRDGELHITRWFKRKSGHLDSEAAIVLSETVGQYIGLQDSKGNKIFEGDIIKVVTEDTHEERFIEVCVGEFTDDGSGDLFVGAYLKYERYTVSAGQIKEFGSNGVEIVGNIHDNPELLTDKT